MSFLIHLLVTTVAVFITAWILKAGVKLEKPLAAFWFALVLALLNAVVKPILFILSLPLTILTLGLFYLVLNVFMVWLADKFVRGITIKNFGWAILFALVLWLVNMVLGWVLPG